MNDKMQSQQCCPEFKPAPWDDKIFQWENKRFIKDKVRTLFYMPLNFGGAVKRMNAKVDKADAAIQDWLMLSDHTSKWNMDLYIAVDKEVQDAANVTISGKFFSKVYEGNFNQTGKWCSDFEQLTKAKGLAVKKMYMWYTTCPKCAKKYGKNYVVIIGQVD